MRVFTTPRNKYVVMPKATTHQNVFDNLSSNVTTMRISNYIPTVKCNIAESMMNSKGKVSLGEKSA